MATKKATTASAVKPAPTAPQVEEFIIEDNIPIPQRSKGKYPIELMKVGQSFLVRCKEEDMKKTKASLAAAARRVAAASDGIRQFFVLDRPEEGGVRIWREEDEQGENEVVEMGPEPEPPATPHTFPSIG